MVDQEGNVSVIPIHGRENELIGLAVGKYTNLYCLPLQLYINCYELLNQLQCHSIPQVIPRIPRKMYQKSQ